MKTKLLWLWLALCAVVTLSGCEAQTDVYSAPVNFELNANCDADNLKKIETLFKSKSLPLGNRTTISVIVDLGADDATRIRIFEDKVKEILVKSSTVITPRDFHALNTGATETIYSAFYTIDNQMIGSKVTDYSR